MSQEQMSQEDFAIVKLAAAQRYKERNIHPETANYLFERKLSKLAQVPQPKPAGGVMPAVRRAVNEDRRGTIRDAIGPSKPVRRPLKTNPPAAPAKPQASKAAAAPDKITKLAGALKNVLPPKQADVKAAKAAKLSEGLKKLVNG